MSIDNKLSKILAKGFGWLIKFGKKTYFLQGYLFSIFSWVCISVWGTYLEIELSNEDWDNYSK